MKITKENLRILYAKCNEKYFNGELGKCDFSIFPQNNPSFGWYNGRDDKYGRPNDKIWIGTCIEWTEDKLERVMVHEMIHMYNHRAEKKKWKGLLGHGKCFRKHCKRIKREFGIDALYKNDLEYINKEFSPKAWDRFLFWLIDR